MQKTEKPLESIDEAEVREWLDSLDYILERWGPEKTRSLLTQLFEKAFRKGVDTPLTVNTPYINTIPLEKQPAFPGNRDIERRIKSIIRWNAMAMVVRANLVSPGIGGHISTYASAATLYEVAFNHFLRGKSHDFSGDQVFFQGHAVPGIYAFLGACATRRVSFSPLALGVRFRFGRSTVIDGLDAVGRCLWRLIPSTCPDTILCPSHPRAPPH